jgi:hypothetical protein
MTTDTRTSTPTRTVVVRTSIAKLTARLYLQATPVIRAQLLSNLLRPVGPLALVAIAAGAFARLLPTTRWHAAEVTPDAADGFGADHVAELVRYVEQKSPELLWQLPAHVGDSRLWLGTATGTLLLLALRARRRRKEGAGAAPIEPRRAGDADAGEQAPPPPALAAEVP